LRVPIHVVRTTGIDSSVNLHGFSWKEIDPKTDVVGRHVSVITEIAFIRAVTEAFLAAQISLSEHAAGLGAGIG
jgi:hypothetical protein